MNILLADDHDLLRDVLKSYLEGLGLDISVRQARTLKEALERAKETPDLDLILLDIDMPGMNGLSGLDRLRDLHPGVPVAILSGLSDPANVVEALRRGAAGFIPKSLGARAAVRAIQLMLDGERYVPSVVVEEVNARLASPSEATAASAEQTNLTQEENTVLRLLKEGASNKEIARALNVQEYTVKYYMRGLFKKLGAKNRTHAVMIAADRRS